MLTYQTKWVRIVYIVGVVLSIVGIFDLMEGSIVIIIGCALTALTTFIARDRHRKIFLINFILMLFGVFFLFFLSSLGGIGGKSSLSMWWGILILPYLIAVLGNIVLLTVRAFKKKVQSDV